MSRFLHYIRSLRFETPRCSALYAHSAFPGQIWSSPRCTGSSIRTEIFLARKWQVQRGSSSWLFEPQPKCFTTASTSLCYHPSTVYQHDSPNTQLKMTHPWQTCLRSKSLAWYNLPVEENWWEHNGGAWWEECFFAPPVAASDEKRIV